jgi:hypothetical protein
MKLRNPFLSFVARHRIAWSTTSGENYETTREVTELELHDPKDATKEVLKLAGAYKQPEGGEVKFLVLRSLDEVEAE